MAQSKRKRKTKKKTEENTNKHKFIDTHSHTKRRTVMKARHQTNIIIHTHLHQPNNPSSCPSSATVRPNISLLLLTHSITRSHHHTLTHIICIHVSGAHTTQPTIATQTLGTRYPIILLIKFHVAALKIVLSFHTPTQTATHACSQLQ